MIQEFISTVNLSSLDENQRWSLYQAFVIFNLVANGYHGDPFETASSLDMSFDEVKHSDDVNFWLSKIKKDLEDYIRSCKYLFSKSKSH